VKRARIEGPFVQRKPSGSERVLEALPRAGAVAVQGHRKTVNAKLGHRAPNLLPCSEYRAPLLLVNGIL